MKRKTISILTALVLIVSFSLMTAVPAAADDLTSVTSMPDVATAGATTGYTIAFTTATSGNISTVDMAFPAGFDVSEASDGGGSTGVGEGAVTVLDQVVTYSVDNPVVIADSTAISIDLGDIINTQTAGTTYQVTVTTANTSTTIDGPTASSNFAIVHGAPDHFLVETENAGMETAGTAFSVTLTAQDQYGNLAWGYNGGAVSIDFDSTATAAPDTTTPTIPTPQTLDFSGTPGIATATGFILVNAGETPTITGDDGSIEGTTDAITVNPAAFDADLSTVGVDATTKTAGETVAVTVTPKDIYGNLLGTGETVVVMLDGSTSDYSGEIAEFDEGDGTYTADVMVTDVSAANIISATVGGSAITQTQDITVNPAAADAALSTVGVDETTRTAGESVAVTVTPIDAYGNELGTGETVVVMLDDVAADNAGPISVTDVGDGTYTASVMVTDTSAGNVISATAGGVLITQTHTITVNPDVLAAYTVEPESVKYTAGTPFDVTITAVDQYGNPLSADYVTDEPYGWATNASNAPDTTVPDIGTVAADDFTDDTAVIEVTLYCAEDDVTFTVTDNSLITGTSEGITVEPGDAVSIQVLPDEATISAGADQAYSVNATDAYGNIYVVTADTWDIDAEAGGIWADSVYTSEFVGEWQVQGDYLALTDNATLTVTAGLVDTLTITQEPTDTVAGEPISPAIVVNAVDVFFNPVPDQDITVILLAGDGTLSGNLTRTTDSLGNATFDDLWIDLVGMDKELQFSADGALAGSALFSITPAAADYFGFGAIGAQNSGESFSITITAYDEFDNVATDYTDNATLSDLTGTIDPAITDNFTAGVWAGLVTVEYDDPDFETMEDSITATGTVATEVTGTSNEFTLVPYPVYNLTAGQGYPTIQAAIDAASPGDDILVAPGYYDESLSIDKSLTLRSQAGYEDTDIEGSVYMDLGWDIDEETPLAETVAFEGFEVWGDEVLIDAYLDNGSSVTITENILDECVWAVWLNSDNGSSATIEDNIIELCDSDGIWLEEVLDGSSVSIAGNLIEDCDTAIYCEGDTLEGSSVSIEGNEITDNMYGIWLEEVLDGSEVNISENDIYSNYNGDGIGFNAVAESDVTILDNYIYDNSGGCGIYVYESIETDSTVTIAGNTVGAWADEEEEYYGNEYDGIYIEGLYEGSTVTIDDNLVLGNGDEDGYGVCVYEVEDDCTVAITSNAIAYSADEGVYVEYLYEGSTLTIEDNTIGAYNYSDTLTFDGNDENGVYVGYVDYGSSVSITGNTINENGEDGIEVYYIGWEGENGLNAAEYYAGFQEEWGANYLTIAENTVNGNDDDGIYVSYANFASYVTIQDNTASQNEDGIVLEHLGQECYDFYLDDDSADVHPDPAYPDYFGPVVLVKGNTLTDNEEYGIYQFDYWEYGTTVTIEDNVISGNWDCGIYGSYDVANDAHVVVRDNTIVSNGIVDWDGGIYLYYSDEASIVYRGTYTIEGNFIAGNFGEGIYAESVYDNGSLTIRGNTIGAGTDGQGNAYAGNEDDGIYIYEVYYDGTVEITRNSIAGNNERGIYFYDVDDDSNVSITRNDILDNAKKGICIDDLDDTCSFDVNYNNIAGNDWSGNDIGVKNEWEGDGYVDATYNWWGDASGPSRQGPGTGDGVSDYVIFSPWLTSPAVWEVKASLTGGWNTLATPVALDSAADELAELGLDMEIAYGFSGGAWVVITTANDNLAPCSAIYIKMNSAAEIDFTPKEDYSDPPSKALSAGWNLVSLANLSRMAADDALASAYLVSGDLSGYAQVVSPAVNGLEWSAVRGPAIDTDLGYDMLPSKGYWLFMTNAGVLAGFTSTPVDLY